MLEIDPGQDTIYVELKKEKKGKTNEVRVNNSCSIYKINKELQSNDELMHIYTRIDMTSYIQMI